MFIGGDMLRLLLLGFALALGARAARPAATLGRADPVVACEVPIEVAGLGVRCFSRGEAVARGVTAGAGMPADRWAAWAVPVDVNRASVAELASLDGIGPKLAARIVAARPFASVDDVARVSGIGQRRLARLRPRLVLDDGGPDHVR
jgi:competence ComEA-like helix-hairpin-helix protein